MEKRKKKMPPLLKEGDLVCLTGEEFKYEASRGNPHVDSKYSCNGIISEIIIHNEGRIGMEYKEIFVDWDNGNVNTYDETSLTKVVKKEISPTISILVLNSDVKLGDVVLIPKGKRLYTQGDYIHNEESTVFIKVFPEINKKKYLSKSISK